MSTGSSIREGCVLGIDSSTTATKVIAFDRTGSVITSGTSEYPVIVQRPGWVEQRADDWWQALKAAAAAVMRDPAMAGRSISGIAITHQRFSFVPVDHRLRPLRNAILWNDLRAADQAQAARNTVGTEKVFRETGYPPGQWTLYRLLWMRDHEQDVYRETDKILLVHDFLAHRLTGRLATTESSAAMTGALDISARNTWARDIIDALGARNDVWVEPILAAGAQVGTITDHAAAETSLPAGVPVFAGAGDQPCGSLGAGAVDAGTAAVNAGTSCSCELAVDALPELRAADYFVEISPTGSYIIENDVPSGASAVLRWYREGFGAADERKTDQTGSGVWDVILSRLDETSPGNDGFMVVPYLQGVYGPYWDQNARGVFLGLRAGHR